MSRARIRWISGPVLHAVAEGPFALREAVRVGPAALLGEVVRLDGDEIVVQVYEDTIGFRPGTEVVGTGLPLAIPLGPGLLGRIFDGLLRPLSGSDSSFVAPGMRRATPGAFAFVPRIREGDTLVGGAILGEATREGTRAQACLAPPDAGGTVLSVVAAGTVREDATVCTLRAPDGTTRALSLSHEWPVRAPRPVARRLAADRPLVTGQRIFDLLFPLAEGGTIAVPGGFGTGKTIVEHSLAKYAEADVVVFVGCGERGNEMAEVLQDFPRLVDPRTGRPVMERTVLVVNTSNMPVVAREASVYLGLTIAEYYRDMGYRVAVMVDSLSRWAEALRDIAARLQEMPGEEGYPTHMASRLGAIYERAGRARVLGAPERTGSVTLVCAISPPGGDFSEPVTQASLRVAGGLWALDAQLARARQFPAIDWSTSYSLYVDTVTPALAAATTSAWPTLRARILALLQRDAELREIASLLGADELEDRDRLTLAIAALVREHLLGQNAFDPNDAMSPLDKTARLATFAIAALDAADARLVAGAELDALPLGELRRAYAELRRSPPADEQTRRAALEHVLATLRGAS